MYVGRQPGMTWGYQDRFILECLEFAVGSHTFSASNLVVATGYLLPNVCGALIKLDAIGGPELLYRSVWSKLGSSKYVYIYIYIHIYIYNHILYIHILAALDI